MSFTWTNELTDTLIDLYYTQRVLWDLSDENYKNKNMKRDAWKTISDTMGLHDLEIQRKIKNLTAQFFRERKKIKNDKFGAAGSDTPRWFAYQRLLFLTDRNEPRTYVEKDINEPDDNGPEKSIEEKISQNESLSPNEIIEINDMMTVQMSPDSRPIRLPQPDTRKNGKGSKRKKSIQEAYNVIKKLQAKKSRNRFSIFGELVATKIEHLQSSYAQNVAEHLISNILFEASIGNYDYPSVRQMTPSSTQSSNSKISIHTHLQSPNYASSPSPQFEHPTIASQHTQNTLPETIDDQKSSIIIQEENNANITLN